MESNREREFGPELWGCSMKRPGRRGRPGKEAGNQRPSEKENLENGGCWMVDIGRSGYPWPLRLGLKMTTGHSKVKATVKPHFLQSEPSNML